MRRNTSTSPYSGQIQTKGDQRTSHIEHWARSQRESHIQFNTNGWMAERAASTSGSPDAERGRENDELWAVLSLAKSERNGFGCSFCVFLVSSKIYGNSIFRTVNESLPRTAKWQSSAEISIQSLFISFTVSAFFATPNFIISRGQCCLSANEYEKGAISISSRSRWALKFSLPSLWLECNLIWVGTEDADDGAALLRREIVNKIELQYVYKSIKWPSWAIQFGLE